MKVWDLKRFSTFQIDGCGCTKTGQLDTYRFHGIDGAYAKVTLIGFEPEGVFHLMPPNGEVINGTLDDKYSSSGGVL